MNKENGGPAFPLCIEVGENIHLDLGMTLRDYFAAKAMQGMLGNSGMGMWGPDAEKSYALSAYSMADAMLAQREKEAGK